MSRKCSHFTGNGVVSLADISRSIFWIIVWDNRADVITRADIIRFLIYLYKPRHSTYLKKNWQHNLMTFSSTASIWFCFLASDILRITVFEDRLANETSLHKGQTPQLPVSHACTASVLFHLKCQSGSTTASWQLNSGGIRDQTVNRCLFPKFVFLFFGFGSLYWKENGINNPDTRGAALI